mgnify:CR=1 FL=1
MVAQQIEARGLRDPELLRAFRTVPRHKFVEGTEAYADRALPVGSGQTISQPFVVAAMTVSSLLLAPAIVLGYGFLEASAKAKIANLVTNLSAIAVFAASGSILWTLGLMMGAANLVGGLLGARTAISRGNAFIRRVFLFVLAGLIIKLAYDTVAQLRG